MSSLHATSTGGPIGGSSKAASTVSNVLVSVSTVRSPSAAAVHQNHTELIWGSAAAQVDALSASYRTFGDQLEPLRAERVRLEQALTIIPREMSNMPRDAIERACQPRQRRLEEVQDEIVFLTAAREKVSRDFQALGQLVGKLRAYLKIGDNTVLSVTAPSVGE